MKRKEWRVKDYNIDIGMRDLERLNLTISFPAWLFVRLRFFPELVTEGRTYQRQGSS